MAHTLVEYCEFAKQVLASEGMLATLYADDVLSACDDEAYVDDASFTADEVWTDYYAWLQMDSTDELRGEG